MTGCATAAPFKDQMTAFGFTPDTVLEAPRHQLARARQNKA